MPKISTKKGDIYNNLEAIEHSHRKNGITYWKFKCLLCNTNHITALQDVRRGKTKSCGCQLNKGAKNGQWKGYEGLSGRTYSHYKDNAHKRDIEFNISSEELWKVYIRQDKKCPYTGIDLILECKDSDSRTPSNASLDRIDSNKGYITDNVVWVYKPINNFKGTFSQEEFINLCKLVANYHE